VYQPFFVSSVPLVPASWYSAACSGSGNQSVWTLILLPQADRKVLTAVELLAAETNADLAVVDVGGATTDVYSAVRPDGERAVAGTVWCARTVEGDLGVRAGAPGIVEAAASERLLRPDERGQLAAAARVRADDSAYLPDTAPARAAEVRLGGLAATVALRRHARAMPPDVAGRDLSRVRVLIGSGGVFRYAHGARTLLAEVLDDHAGGWAVPRSADVVVDERYVLAPAGLLAADHPDAARALLRRLVSHTPLARNGSSIQD